MYCYIALHVYNSVPSLSHISGMLYGNWL